MSDPVKPTAFTWALFILGRALPTTELSDAQAEILVRNAMKVASVLIALSPDASGIPTKDVQ